MRVVLQRVREAEVLIGENENDEGISNGKIGNGLVILLGVGKNDTNSDVDWMVDKIINLRIFPDEELKMNKSLLDINGEALVVSQFTLYGDCRKGRRPGFSDAALPEKAEVLYKHFIEVIGSRAIKVQEGVFQATMLVKIYNQGPVTILLDSEKRF